MFKRLVAVLIMVVMCIVNISSVYALPKEIEMEYPPDVQIVVNSMRFGNLTKKRNLLNLQGETVAFYLEFENGYLIYGANGVTIEYSDCSFPCFASSDLDVFYVGPFQYFYREENSFVNFGNGEKLSIEEFVKYNILESLSDTSTVGDITNYSVYASSTPTVSSKILTAPERCFYYNTDGSCGSLAITMLLVYYADIRNAKLVTDFFLTYPKALYDQLKRYVEIDGDLCPSGQSNLHGSNPISRQIGLDAFLKVYGTEIGKKSRLTDVNNIPMLNMAHMVIDMGGVPAIISWDTDGNGSLDHEVLTYGYRKITLNGELIRADFVVNDGWGQSKVFINMDRCDYFQCLL